MLAAQALATQLQTSSATLSTTLTQTAKQNPDTALAKAFKTNKACKTVA